MPADYAAFKLDIAKFAAKAREKADLVARKVVFDLGSSVIMMTPVGNPNLWKHPGPKGYVGGRLRGNWQFAIDAPPDGEFEVPDPSGDGSRANILGASAGFSMGDTGYIANNLSYAWSIEMGHSTQAPAGMVRVTVERFTEFVDTACSEVKDL
jgi:hypothetical protein